MSDDLDRRLREVLSQLPLPDAPSSLRDAIDRVGEESVRPSLRMAGAPRGWPATAVLAAAVALLALLAVVGSLGTARPVPTRVSTAVVPCVESAPTTYGSWWVEIGGPNAYFNVKPGTLYATDNPWKIIVRFDPDAAQGETVDMSAEAMPSGRRIDATLDSRMNPSSIYHFASPAPDLPGGWYLFEQRIPTAGCWRLSASIDGRIGGTANLSVVSGARSPDTSGSPGAPTPEIASPTPTVDMSP